MRVEPEMFVFFPMVIRCAMMSSVSLPKPLLSPMTSVGRSAKRAAKQMVDLPSSHTFEPTMMSPSPCTQ